MGLSWPQCPGPLISNVSCFGDPASGALASLTLLQPPRLGHQNSLHSRFSAKQQAVLSPENLVQLKTDLIYVSINIEMEIPPDNKYHQQRRIGQLFSKRLIIFID